MSNERLVGYVKNWINDRNYGFLVSDAGEEFFVHRSQFPPSYRPQIDDKVEFTVGAGKYGKTQAINVIPLTKRAEEEA